MTTAAPAVVAATAGDDALFVLQRLLHAADRFKALPAFAEVDDELMGQVASAVHAFTRDHLAPLNASGDAEGCRLLGDGSVRTPRGFREAWAAFVEAGWPALACDPDDGGQGLPHTLDALLHEAVSATNPGWGMFFGILHGAYACLRAHGSEELKAAYLPKIASGEWLVTMALTEAQAGSDLGQVRTRAEPLADGAHALHGTKIFISGGDHDLTDNIVHLVLARLPDAPAGSKGLSLFLVPKQLPDGSRNRVVVERIEEKMGLHGSPTCVLRFDGATGWLVGEPHRGLNAMFVMMNAARINVGLQGVGAAQAALEAAQAYAAERVQSRQAIALHAPVQRLLAQTRAWTEGGRMLALWTALLLDESHAHPQADRRAAALACASLATPVVKALLTEQGYRGVNDCLQVFGGHGYVREWGIEQRVRDLRVALLYEGTNEIQALDLLQRKLVPDEGQALGLALEALRALGVERSAHAAAAGDAAARLQAGLSSLMAAARNDDAVLPQAAAGVMRAVGLVLFAQLWAAAEAAAHRDTPFDRRKRATAAVFFDQLLPELEARLAELRGIAAEPRRRAGSLAAAAC